MTIGTAASMKYIKKGTGKVFELLNCWIANLIRQAGMFVWQPYLPAKPTDTG
jgi:hypothetical protein